MGIAFRTAKLVAGDRSRGPPPPYSGGADWWTLGVLLYELTEQELPFGDDPEYLSRKREYRVPALELDGKLIVDSSRILAAVDDAFAHSSTFSARRLRNRDNLEDAEKPLFSMTSTRGAVHSHAT